jgi:hypothetical protein
MHVIVRYRGLQFGLQFALGRTHSLTFATNSICIAD